MALALRWLVLAFGAICCAIALAHIALGPAAIPGGVVTNATMDSEDRFYATLFLGFGAALIWCARDFAGRGGVFKALLAVFFLGGLARLVSMAMIGPPSGLFQFLTGVELVLPLLLWWMWRRVHGKPE
jgi:hypothetical protein